MTYASAVIVEPSAALHAVHIVAVPGGEAAGPSYTVPRLCMSLHEAGAKADLLSIGPPDVEVNGNFRHARFAPDWSSIPVVRALRSSRSLRQQLVKLSTQVDVVHNHGLWLMPNVHAGWAASQAKKPLIVAPRGMLGRAALQFSALKKAAFWSLLQRRVLQGAACLHATSEQEYLEIRAVGLRAPVAIVPNGVDLPELPPKVDRSSIRTVLYLGRLHPKKGLDLLVRAWAKVEQAHPNWQLRLVGPSELGYGEYLRSLARSEGLQRVVFETPLFGAEKLAAYRAADIYVLPSLNENFAMTVAEALVAELPVIASKGTPWSGLVAEHCGWWIDEGVQPLVNVLSKAMTMPAEELQAMGQRGREWMGRDFSWRLIGVKMLQVYEWLVHGTRVPSFVEIA